MSGRVMMLLAGAVLAGSVVATDAQARGTEKPGSAWPQAYGIEGRQVAAPPGAPPARTTVVRRTAASRCGSMAPTARSHPTGMRSEAPSPRAFWSAIEFGEGDCARCRHVYDPAKPTMTAAPSAPPSATAGVHHG